MPIKLHKNVIFACKENQFKKSARLCICSIVGYLILKIVCSVFRKHETALIREEETFSSKRCLEWFYEYAGEQA